MGSEKISWSEAIEITQETARKAEAERSKDREEEAAVNRLVDDRDETIEALRRRVAELEEEKQQRIAYQAIQQSGMAIALDCADDTSFSLKERFDRLRARVNHWCAIRGDDGSVDGVRHKWHAELVESIARQILPGIALIRAENSELKAKLSAVNDLIDTYDSIDLEYEKQHRIWNCLCDGVYFAIGATKEDAFHNAARATANCGEQPLSEIQAVHDAILRGDD